MLSSQYPYYGPLGRGNYNVSLAFFGPTSEISKSIGLESSTGLALPNTDFIQKFAQGDLGISDSFIKEMLAKNINNPISQKNPDVLKQFISLNKLDIDLEKYKIGNKISVPSSAIKVPESMQMTGFKAFEKTALQSIFETQKPFMEIVKIAIGSAAKSEDIIARVMPLSGNPLKTKSRKPVGNAGTNSRPKAIGYRKGEELKKHLNDLSSIESERKLKGVKALEEDIQNNNNIIISNDLGFNTNSYWRILSTQYSTGTFDPKVDYVYSYINLPADEKKPVINEDIELEQEIEYDKYKPKVLIFGIYDSKGMVLDPNERLKTSGLFGNNITEIETPFKKASWIFSSPKWKLPEGMHEWPIFSSPNYVWEKKTFGKIITKVSKKKPGSGYKIKVYKKGEINKLTGEIAIVGSSVIDSFDTLEKESYRNYYNDLIRLSLDDNKLTDEEKEQAFKDVNEILDIEPQLEAVYSYGHTKASIYNRIGGKKAYPDALKRSYRPFEIFVPESQKDEKLNRLAQKTNKKPGYIWIDPEADYDLKVIRIDPKTIIEYRNGLDAEIRIGKVFFVKNRVKFSISNNAEFGISISKNGADNKIFNNIKEYFFENWNYENNKIVNTNIYNVSLWTYDAPKKYNKENYKWKNGIKTQASVVRTVQTTTTERLLNWNEINVNWSDLSQIWSNIHTEDKVENIITKNTPEEKKWATLTKNNGQWIYNSDIKNGIITLQDGTTIQVEDSVVKRWYYIYNNDFKGPNTNYNLPSFGTERHFIVNYDTEAIDIKDKSISLFKLRVENSDTSSVLIDPDQVTNSFLTSPDIFIKDPQFYGTGSEEDPQTLGIINRYALTDLDKESYYIVEGILKTENEFETDDDGNRKNSGRGKGGGWYRITHALGATSQFSKLLTDIITKLIPKITKLLKLLKNPVSFITDIMVELLGKNFEFLSNDAISSFQKSISIKQQLASQMSGIDTISEQINNTRLQNTLLSRKILNDARGKSNIEFLQAEKMSLDIMRKGEENIAEMEKVLNKKKSLSKKLTRFYKSSILSNYAYVDEKTLDIISPLDGSAIIPLSLFGADLSFGLASNMSAVPKKLPISLIFRNTKTKFNNVQFLIDNAKPKLKNIYQSLDQIKKDEIINLNNPVNYQVAQLDNKPPQINSYFLQDIDIKFEDGTSTTISNNLLDKFIKDNRNKYNFVYVTEILNKELADVDTLLQNGTQQDLDIAKEKLDNLRKNYPNNSLIDDKYKELNNKNKALSKNVQPLLKSLLGFVTFPLKIVGDIIQWMLNFFKSIKSPMKLASKMKEFLSFKWISQFLTPKGILEIFGFKFNPGSVGVEDLSQFLDVNFIPTLPTYRKEHLKDLAQQPLRLLTILKLMQKIINAVIDFIWSLFGIEALMKSPHVKIVPTDIEIDNSKNAMKTITDFFNSNVINSGSETILIDSNDNTFQNQIEVYEVELPDGTIKSYFTKAELDTFIKDNPDMNFDFAN